jgi:hypothetical protein
MKTKPDYGIVPKLRILTIRDQRVLLDADLARLYGVETRALNQAVKRNQDRFPAEFAFQPIFPRLTSQADVIDLQWSHINKGFHLCPIIKKRKIQWVQAKNRPYG